MYLRGNSKIRENLEPGWMWGWDKGEEELKVISLIHVHLKSDSLYHQDHIL